MMSQLCQKGKKQKKKKKKLGEGWVTDIILERTCPEEHPKSEKNRASLANKATVSVSPKIRYPVDRNLDFF